ncbi:MAG: hypothetical protein BWY09_02080 [Candidatus Hydrogenedentes bacterium ADurb.Bin179]|nr:MAG: hypothetical protein BWY09_02080 [Candidatus Hydrogenedentes bacterium ADurb.Bin179]
MARHGHGLFAARTPQVAVAHVVVVRDGDDRPVAENRVELTAELEPVAQVMFMVIDLVAGEEQQVRVRLLDVFDDVRARDVTAVLLVDGITTEHADHNGVLLDGVATDAPFIQGFAVERTHPVGAVPGHVPALHAEMGGPRFVPGLVAVRILGNDSVSDIFPLPVFLNLKHRVTAFTILQRIELRRHLENVIVDRIKGKRDTLAFGHFRNNHLFRDGPGHTCEQAEWDRQIKELFHEHPFSTR